MARHWPLVERREEFEVIRSALTPQSEGCGIVITGDAGVGKTTLARRATGSLHDKVRWVAGTESARSIPLGVFAHLVSASSSRDPVAFLSSARESLLSQGRIVIGVDDAHLLDQLSATLLHQLAIDRAARIVATIRSGEKVPDAVTALWKDGHLGHLDLTPFSKAESIRLIESVLGGHLEGLSADLMWEASGGNALFLRHMVEGALETRVLREVNGVWQLRGRTAITSELASLLEDRIDDLPESVCHALKLLAFCEPIDLEVLSGLVEDETIDDAENRGLISIAQDERLSARFNHPLFGEVIRRRVGRASSRRLRGQLVKALRAQEVRTAADRIRLAELTLDSDQPRDLKLFSSAAKDAISLANVPLGEKFARESIKHGGGLESADLLARALLWQGRPDEAEAVLTEFDPDDLNPIQLVRWGTSRVSNLFWAMGKAEQADEVLDFLRGRVTEPALLHVVDGIASVCATFENRLDDAIETAKRVLDAPVAVPWALEWAYFGCGLALALKGRGSEVKDIAARARAVERRTDGLVRAPAGYGEILALTLTGDLRGAQQRAASYFEFSSTGQYLAWGLANILGGTADFAQGQLPKTKDRMEQALAALAAESASSWSFPAWITLAQAYAILGNPAGARAMIAEADKRVGAHVAVFGPMLHIAKAWAAAAEGMTSLASESAHVAADIAAKSGQHAVEAEALHLLVRLGDRSVAQRLDTLAAQLDGTMGRLFAWHAHAIEDDNGGELAAVATEFERMGAVLLAADAAAQAASSYSRHGDRARTAALAATATRLAAACGGAATPALLEAAHPLPLTAREREIAKLVAAGLSNREIADRLTVSVRTVEGHLYRACIKLDISDRDALAALMLAEK